MKPSKCKVIKCTYSEQPRKKKMLVKGYCDKHYQRYRKYGNANIVKTYDNRTKHPLYEVWRNMKQRCLNTNRKDYIRYGGRGITVCEEWRNDFPTFVKDVGKRPSKKHLLDRIDNDGNYEPDNVRWLSTKESAINKSNNHRIAYRGIDKTLIEWSKIKKINRHTLQKRLAYGWSIERALDEPINYCGRGNENRRYPE